MALASFDNEVHNPSPSYQEVSSQPIGKSLATVFGYMAIGVLLTLAVSAGVAALFYNLFGQRTLEEVANAFQTGDLDGALIAYIIVLISSFIGLFAMSFVMGRSLASDKHSAWPAFLIYASLMGVMLSTFVMVVDILTLVEALGATVVAFAVMFLIGRFSKINLNPLGLVAMGIAIAFMIVGLFWAIFAWVNPAGFRTFDLVFSFVIVGVMMIITAVDAYNIKNILDKGMASRNVLLFCAFTLYSDFITMLIRILYLILRLQGRNK